MKAGFARASWTLRIAMGAAIMLFGRAVIPSEALAANAADQLQAMRQSGDMTAQRRHVWGVIARLTQTFTRDGRTEPLFQSWWGEDAVFGAGAQARGIGGFARTAQQDGAQRTNVPVITYTFYNDAAFDHIRRYHLDRSATLERLRKTGKPADGIAANRAVPAFPAQSIVLKTAWWPIAQDGITAIPVWDPQTNAPAPGGNPYIAWRRVVAVEPSYKPLPGETVATDFAGRSFAAAHRVALDAFYHVRVDAPLARHLMQDPESRKAVLIGLGRTLRAGDQIALVAANLATREVPDWIWAALWWHDDPGHGPFAAGRPADLKSAWRNYLMQAAFDPQTPRSAQGAPHVCFNPWLEGRFPDGGQGGGVLSNCLACHSRASYPAVSFLPVTRGAADQRHDPAFAPGRLRTSFLWSLAMHARR